MRNGAKDKTAPLSSQRQSLAWNSIKDEILQQASERWVAASHLGLNVGGQPRVE